MYFLKIVDYLFGSSLEKSGLVSLVQNVHTMGTSILCGVGLFYSASCATTDAFPLLLKTISLQCFVDLFLTSKFDIVLHHGIVLSMCYFTLNYLNSSLDRLYTPIAVLISSELSSFFLVLVNYFPQSLWAKLSFAGVFFYTRNYLLLTYFFFDESADVYIKTLVDERTYVWYKMTMLSFVSLNLYWTAAIVKKIYKSIRANKGVMSEKTIEFMLQFTYIVTPILSLHAYRHCSGYLYLVDIAGQLVLSASSYRYHNSLYRQLELRPERPLSEIDLGHNAVFPHYLADMICIQVRVFLNFAVHQLSAGRGGSALYFMASVQAATIYDYYIALWRLRRYRTKITNTKTNLWMRCALHVPLGVANFIHYWNHNHFRSASHLFVSSMLLTVVVHVVPFYEMNHLIFHFVTYYHTYASSSANASLCQNV